MPKIYVLHENPEWFEPLAQSLRALNTPFEEWLTVEGITDLNAAPPEGVFFNRMSASAHTRDHRYAVEYAETVLAWLERHGRRVINARHTLTFETKKFDQYAQLSAFGIKVPKTIAAVGQEALIEAVEKLGSAPFIVKPNRGGKGLGVQLFSSVKDLKQTISSGDIEQCASLDGVYLVQDYIKARTPHIIRAEFIGGRFHYAVQVNTSGGFELCPADVCAIDAPPATGEFCMTDTAEEKFQLLPDYTHENIARYEAFLQDKNIDVAAIESLEAADGTRYTYDVNVNTNYNKQAESAAGIPQGAYDRLAEYLAEQLSQLSSHAA